MYPSIDQRRWLRTMFGKYVSQILLVVLPCRCLVDSILNRQFGWWENLCNPRCWYVLVFSYDWQIIMSLGDGHGLQTDDKSTISVKTPPLPPSAGYHDGENATWAGLLAPNAAGPHVHGTVGSRVSRPRRRDRRLCLCRGEQGGGSPARINDRTTVRINDR